METCLIFSGGPHTKSPRSELAVREAKGNGAAIFAADSGANHAIEQYGVFPEIVFGDEDSIHETTRRILKERGVLFDCSDTTLLSVPEGQTGPLNASQKDQTDLELALNSAINQGARRITIIGGTSDERYAHAFGNGVLLAIYAKRHPQVPIEIISGKQRVWARCGPTTEVIRGQKGDTLDLLPYGTDARRVRTKGLLYPLDDERLEEGVRGIDNKFLTNEVTVFFKRGVMIFTHVQAE